MNRARTPATRGMATVILVAAFSGCAQSSTAPTPTADVGGVWSGQISVRDPGNSLQECRCPATASVEQSGARISGTMTWSEDGECDTARDWAVRGEVDGNNVFVLLGSGASERRASGLLHPDGWLRLRTFNTQWELRR